MSRRSDSLSNMSLDCGRARCAACRARSRYCTRSCRLQSWLGHSASLCSTLLAALKRPWRRWYFQRTSPAARFLSHLLLRKISMSVTYLSSRISSTQWSRLFASKWSKMMPWTGGTAGAGSAVEAEDVVAFEVGRKLSAAFGVMSKRSATVLLSKNSTNAQLCSSGNGLSALKRASKSTLARPRAALSMPLRSSLLDCKCWTLSMQISAAPRISSRAMARMLCVSTSQRSSAELEETHCTQRLRRSPVVAAATAAPSTRARVKH
mmetsp:Transcript_137476/g.256664  ORF Transcript_137476/g.256664 Transcript_137476/m.256664 type:complete len:264 (+) Transcript_137476:1151-1942(+)